MSKWILCGAVLLIVPTLFGSLWNKIWKLKITTVADVFVPGLFLLFCFFEATTVLSMKLNWKLSRTVFLDSCLLLVLCGVACMLCQKELRQIFIINPIKRITIKKVILAVFFLLQITVIIHFAPVVQEDNTMEAIQTNLTTDTIGMYNPMTGQAYQSGPTLESKLLITPVFYSCMIQIFHLNPAEFLYRMIPVWILFAGYLVYWLLAEQLFIGKGEEKQDKKVVFMILYACLLLFGDYLFTMLPYRLFHCGWMGETIVVAIVLPFVLSQCMQLKQNIEQKHGFEKYNVVFNLLLACVTVIPLMDAERGFMYLAITLAIAVLTLLIVKIGGKAGTRVCRRS